MHKSEFFAAMLLGLTPILSMADEPKTALEYAQRAYQHEREKRYDEAIADFSKSIELDPTNAEIYFTRSSLFAEGGLAKKPDYAKAVADLTKALEVQPKWYSARFNRGLYFESLREYDKAIADYTKVIDGPTDFSSAGEGEQKSLAHAYHYRGRVYQWYKKDFAKAATDFTESIRLDPTVEMLRYRRGQAYFELKNYEDARHDFLVELETQPDYPNLLNSAAWLFATCPDAKYRDGNKAVEFAEKSNRAWEGKSSETLDILAAAYAEFGEFDKAVSVQKNAIELLKPNLAEKKKQMQARLKLYEAKKPFRSE